jgi:hypothetical protein
VNGQSLKTPVRENFAQRGRAGDTAAGLWVGASTFGKSEAALDRNGHLAEILRNGGEAHRESTLGLRLGLRQRPDDESSVQAAGRPDGGA